MKKLLLLALLLAAPLAAQETPFVVQKSDLMTLKQAPVAGGGGGSSAFSDITSGTNTTAAMDCGTGCTIAASGSGTITATAVPVGGISGLGAGVATWLATATSANLRTALSDETGSGVAVFNDSPSMIAPTFENDTIEAGSTLYKEDGDNGTSAIRVRGQESLPGSRVLRLPDPAPAPVTGTFPVTPVLGYENGEDQIYFHDEMVCGAASGTTEGAGCYRWKFDQTSATWATSGTYTGGWDATNPPGASRCTHDTTNDVCFFGNTSGASNQAMLLSDGWRWRFRTKFSAVSDATDNYTAWLGGTDSITDVNAPANGVAFSYNHATNSGHWTINVMDAAADTTADCGGSAIVADQWYKLEIWYEAGTGVHFYVDGAECTNSPINTDLPTSSGEEFSLKSKVYRTAGAATNRIWSIDYITFGPTPITR